MGRKMERDRRPDETLPEDPDRRAFLRRSVAGVGAATVLPGLADGSAPEPPAARPWCCSKHRTSLRAWAMQR